MEFAPMTTVRLLTGVPLSIDKNNQLYFENQAAQTNYFMSKTFETSNDFSYQRERRAIAYPLLLDRLYGVNYIMYRNDTFGAKWFYAYVIKMEYVNENMTRIFFDVDPFQTWLFELNFKESFIEREHCDRWNPDGSPVINTQPEGLEIGSEYEVIEKTSYSPEADDWYLIASTVSFDKMLSGYPNVILPEKLPMPRPQIVQGMQTGLEYYLIRGEILETADPLPIPNFTGGTSGGGGGGGGGGAFGSYVLPVKSPYNITSDYGMRVHPITGENTMHTGIDFGANLYDPIYAVDGGECVISGWNDIRGYYIVIKHTDTLFSLYQHLQTRQKYAGNTCFQGEVIGQAGTTGSSTGVHLHFEMGTSETGGRFDPGPNIGV